jgi:hypothetical protein
MLPAAALPPLAQTAIENHLATGRRELRRRIGDFLRWMDSAQGRQASPADIQKKYTLLRLRFNDVLSQFDLFADVLTQRSESENGVWLAGLDIVAADALALPGSYFEAPPVICYLERGPGAAIRRARTRLPGGSENPVGIIKVPRERMVGSGIGSSLIHEVGHQGAALLELVESLRPVLYRKQQQSGNGDMTWRLWERWISEIVADFWSVAKIGIGSTTGLMAVVSLPRAFVFRLNEDDPHPVPWIRVKLSAAFGKRLYPHPQWDKLAGIWESYYPLDELDEKLRGVLVKLQESIPDFVELLINHRPKTLRGKSLLEVMPLVERQPARLAAYFELWRRSPRKMRGAAPSLVFAVLGQARVNGRLSPEDESKMLAYLLTYWALRSTLDTSSAYAKQHTCAPLHPPASQSERSLTV